MKYILAVILIGFLSMPVLAESGRWGLGINYGLVNNMKAWSGASSEAGSMVRIDYSFDFNDFYTAAVEIGFFADENVFKTANVPTLTQTAAVLNIDHIFHLRRVGTLAPYLKVGTGLYGLNLWRKANNSFTHNSTDITADVSAGAGVEFWLWSALGNVDLSLPALIHESFMGTKVAYVLSFGWKKYF
ncbi:MAG: outer membrane beta-barrel protein [Candidatus Margulisbacteria bacterium]|nr:outer membrane beta-barrel protein [Candidatus Margulisiibacteriota bacterium]